MGIASNVKSDMIKAFSDPLVWVLLVFGSVLGAAPTPEIVNLIGFVPLAGYSLYKGYIGADDHGN